MNSNGIEDYMKRKSEIDAFHKEEINSYSKATYLEMALNAGTSIAVYFLATYFYFSETSSVLIAASTAFILTARWVVFILMCIEKAVFWVKDDMDNMHN